MLDAGAACVINATEPQQVGNLCENEAITQNLRRWKVICRLRLAVAVAPTGSDSLLDLGCDVMAAIVVPGAARSGWLLLAAAAVLNAVPASSATYDARVFSAAAREQPKVISWRRDIHEHPELSNGEARTGKLVEEHLRKLGLEVRPHVAGHGVIGVLRGGKPGRTVALRADMDALPVVEATGLPFASKATATYQGSTVPVMHACGHDAHTAMLMGAAEILAAMRSEISGTIIFIFQPAEEGPPAGEEGGAPLILKQGVLTQLKPDAVFGLHVVPGEAGKLFWRPGPFMAGADMWEVDVEGVQTHGAMPWLGVDAASVAADIVTSFNQIAARQLDVSHAPTVLSVGQIRLGERQNIIPGKFRMAGTVRTFDPKMRLQVLERLELALRAVEVKFGVKTNFRITLTLPVTSNDSTLAASYSSALSRAAQGKVTENVDYAMGSEDFAVYSAIAPTFFYHLGIGPSAPNHSPSFTIDERALETGVRAHVLTALDFLSGARK